MRCSENILKSIKQKGIILPEKIDQSGPYSLAIFDRGVVVTSGQLPRLQNNDIITGCVRGYHDIELAGQAGKLCLARALLVIHQAIGDLSSMERLLWIRFYFKSSANFALHAEAANPTSEMALDLLGDAGRHTRTVVGVSSLPRNSIVEIEVGAAVRSGSY
jgi:enamine deaminase RidA (YjgF/YER057c/UK114 family)